MLIYLLFYIFLYISVVDILHFGFYLIGANIYDIKRFRQQSQKTEAAPSKPKANPLVSIIIPAHNEEKAITSCLDSVLSSTYSNIEVIVVDDCSKDSTRQLVRQYIKRNPTKNLKLISLWSNLGKAGAVNRALRQRATGQLVMTLDADSVIHSQAVANAVRYFDDPKVVGVAANVRVLDSYSLLGVLQKFEYMIGYRSKKFYSMINAEFVIGGVASTYRMDVLKKVGFYDNDTQTEDITLSLKIAAEGNREHRLVYGVDVLAMTEGVQSFKALLRQRYRWKMGSLQSLIKYRHVVGSLDPKYSKSLTWYRLPMAFIGEAMLLIEPLALAFVIYASFVLLSTAMFIGAYATITLYMMWSVWPDEHLSIRKKLKMSCLAPAMYFVFYIMNVVQLVAIVRCLINYKQVLRKTKMGSSWVSPERSGVAAVQFS